MSRKAPSPNVQILEEASTWFVAFRSEPTDESARQEFQDWLRRSPEHIRAYLEVASTYADIPAPETGRTPPDLIERARTSPDMNVIPLTGPAVTRSQIATARHRGPRLTGSRAVAAAAMLVLAGIGVWLYMERNTYGTEIGEQRSITLPDGSIVELNSRTRVRVAFGAGERRVELLSGQALFQVARDASRPFMVESDHTRVRAIGTQFDVYRKSTGVTVTVIEGRVAVRPAAAGQASGTEPGSGDVRVRSPSGTRSDDGADSREAALAEILLMAGEQLTVTATRAEKAARPNIAAATAWTRHQLVFDGTPLSQVIEEFSRHSRRRMVIDSPQLASLRISGQYTSASPDSLLRFLSLQKGVIVTEVDGEIRIRRE
jgi:transmembrane sensor